MSELNVVSIQDGSPTHTPGCPDPNVITALERLLQLAKDGQITGVAYATHYYDGTGNNHYAGRVGRNTVGQLFAVATRISLAIDQEP